MSSKEFEEQKKVVIKQKANKKINPTDVYKLAQLMARWKANYRLPVCLLCQDASKTPRSLGHLIPYSILEEAGQKYFADLNRGKEFGSKKMGYYAFCMDCEARFQKGENYLNSKFYKTFYHNQARRIEVNSVVADNDTSFPWLYYSFVSIVWRCMCFVAMPDVDEYISVLETLRAYLLHHTDRKKKEAIDSSVKLFVFSPNKDVRVKIAERIVPRQHAHQEILYGTFHAHVFNPIGSERFEWVLMGPVHLLLVYSENNQFRSADKFLGVEDCEKAINHCELRTTAQSFAIADEETRFFPMANMYDRIVEMGTRTIESTLTIKITEQRTEGSNPKPSVVLKRVSHLCLLPSGVTCSQAGEFEYPPDIYKLVSEGEVHYSDNTKILLLWRGENQRVAFVTTLRKINDEQEWRFAVGLTVNEKEEVDYMKGIFIPGPEKIGVDLRHLPIEFKNAVEETIRALLKTLREKLKHADVL